MPDITDTTLDWSAPVAVAADEIWQCTAGAVRLTTDAAPPAREGGLLLRLGESAPVNAGSSVRHRRAGRTAAVISRFVP